MTGIRPFGPALRQLLVVSLEMLVLMLLGLAMMGLSHKVEPPAQRLLILAGEGLSLLGALALLLGSVRVWLQMFRASLKDKGTKHAIF